MTYNVFSGTLNPTHFTSLHVMYISLSALLPEHARTGEIGTQGNWLHLDSGVDLDSGVF